MDPDNSRPINTRQLADSLIPGAEPRDFLLWPPDFFALSSLILTTTGAYSLVVSPLEACQWPPGTPRSWTTKVRKLGHAWRASLDDISDFAKMFFASDRHAQRALIEAHTPPEIVQEFDDFASGISPGADGSIFDLYNEGACTHWKQYQALITLHAAADEACLGWGIRDFHTDPARRAGLFAEERLYSHGTLATINPDRGRVVPKRHTPPMGITLRSLSANLGFHRSSVEVKWVPAQPFPAERTRPLTVLDRMPPIDQPDPFPGPELPQSISSLSVLLLPWPMRIATVDFGVQDAAGIPVAVDDKSFGFFNYQPRPPRDADPDLAQLDAVLKKASAELDNIDMVVLPETALSHTSLDALEATLRAHRIHAYVAGVRDSPRRFGRNTVYFGTMNARNQKYSREKQDKHHRWCLNRSQIQRYSLGSVLSTTRTWWESIRIRRRSVSFINVGQELTICPLVCEDLARQDPIADLIRTIGPSLVVAILMDGPQLLSRWSARYASVLSDDPGSAVITLTSAGMVDRWTPPDGVRRRVIALWSDPESQAREISLDPGALGVLLSLSVERHYEPTADGRLELIATNRVILGGTHQITL